MSDEQAFTAGSPADDERRLVPPADFGRALPLGDLLAFGSHLRADLSREHLLREVAETIQRVARSPHVYIRLRNTDTDHLEAVAFAGVDPATADWLQTVRVPPLFYQALLQAADRVSDAFLVAGRSLAYEPAPAPLPAGRDVLLLPLRGRGDRLLGIIYVLAPSDPAAFDPVDIQVLEAIARQAALALENARLAERSARLLAKQQLLVELGRDVSATLDLQIILRRTLLRLEAAFQRGAIVLGAPDRVPEVLLVSGDPPVAPVTITATVAWVMREGHPYLSNDLAAETDSRFTAVRTADSLPAANDRSFIAVPLRSGGQIIGALCVAHNQPERFSYEDLDLLEAIAAQVGGPITSARLYHEAQRLAAQVQRRAEQLTVLNTLARTATATVHLEPTLHEITAQVQRGFGYHHVELFLLEEETSELVLLARAGLASPLKPGYRQHISLGLMGRVARNGSTEYVADVQFDGDYLQACERPDTRSELVVPIMASGRVLGLLNLESQQPAAFSGEDVAVLETAADMLAGVIENARLARRAREAAVLEERNRLARDLHDSVTQQLFSMTLTAQAARAHMEKNPQRALLQLERLQETATAALAEMRALIFQLRPPALSGQNLVAALQQHGAVLSRREGLRVELTVTGDERHADGIEQALYRIVQEALNNVVKHAAAGSVRVALEFSSERVRVYVADDGCGFDVNAPRADTSRHLGLIGMRERAAELGGTMELYSTIGGGTEVTVVVPRG